MGNQKFFKNARRIIKNFTIIIYKKIVTPLRSRHTKHISTGKTKIYRASDYFNIFTTKKVDIQIFKILLL